MPRRAPALVSSRVSLSLPQAPRGQSHCLAHLQTPGARTSTSQWWMTRLCCSSHCLGLRGADHTVSGASRGSLHTVPTRGSRGIPRTPSFLEKFLEIAQEYCFQDWPHLGQADPLLGLSSGQGEEGACLKDRWQTLGRSPPQPRGKSCKPERTNPQEGSRGHLGTLSGM